MSDSHFASQRERTPKRLAYPASPRHGRDHLKLSRTITDALNQVTTYSHDAVGNVTVRIDARGNRTTVAYDALNRPYQTTDALGGLSTLVYDAVGNVSGQIDARGNRVTFAYEVFLGTHQ